MIAGAVSLYSRYSPDFSFRIVYVTPQAYLIDTFLAYFGRTSKWLPWPNVRS